MNLILFVFVGRYVYGTANQCCIVIWFDSDFVSKINYWRSLFETKIAADESIFHQISSADKENRAFCSRTNRHVKSDRFENTDVRMYNVHSIYWQRSNIVEFEFIHLIIIFFCLCSRYLYTYFCECLNRSDRITNHVAHQHEANK